MNCGGRMKYCHYCNKKFNENEAVDTWYCSRECSDKADIQEEYETYETDEIRCPHCKEVYNDDLDSEYDADGDVFECPNCNKEFVLSAYTSTSFTANLTKEQIDDIYNNNQDCD